MYNIEIEYLTDNGYIETLGYNNVTYVCFRFYSLSICLKNSKDIITFNNVLGVNLTKIDK